MKSTRRLVIIVVVVVIALLLLASPVYGHHPYAAFDNDKTIKIEGKVVQYLFANPHPRLQVEDGQKQRWDVEWARPWDLAIANARDSAGFLAVRRYALICRRKATYC